LFCALLLDAPPAIVSKGGNFVKYVDTGAADLDQTVAAWLQSMVADGPCEFRCQTGYFTAQGSNALLPQLAEWSEQELPQRLLIGSNQAATLASHVAYLAGALGLHRPNVKLGIVSFAGGLFHPKVYHFHRRDGTEAAYVGSANLTGPGLSGQNVEAGIILDSREDDDANVLREIRQRIDHWFDDKRHGLLPINSADDIQRLLDDGYLSLQIERPPPEAGQTEENSDSELGPWRPRRQPLVELSGVPSATAGSGTQTHAQRQHIERAFSYTEASFHYPQGTHLGHILSILWRFSTGREGTSFDDNFIRLRGSLGQGRIAAFRRQIKYKLLAAMELGLLTDIRLAPDPGNFSPQLTEHGGTLWELIAPHIDADQLVMPVGDEPSAKTPQRAPFYTSAIRRAGELSPEFAALYRATVEAMPAVDQMQRFVASFTNDVIAKSDIYGRFFHFQPVIDFCDEVGIEPQTAESAEHRCPFLLNVLESLGQIKQGPRNIVRH
jgi:hypothetical protein